MSRQERDWHSPARNPPAQDIIMHEEQHPTLPEVRRSFNERQRANTRRAQGMGAQVVPGYAVQGVAESFPNRGPEGERHRD